MKLKRLFISVTLALTMVLGLAFPVFADTYLSYYPTTIVDSSGGARTALPVITGINGQALIDAGLISATGLDTRMSIGDASVAGNNIPYMVSETQITTYLDSLPAYGQTEARLYTGYSSDVSGFDIITGTDGYITIPSDISDSMQPGSDFEIEQKGYVDTTGGADTNLVYKGSAFSTYIDGASDIASEILSSTTTTFYPDPSVEVTSVDGWVQHAENDNLSWADLVAKAGTASSDTDASGKVIRITADGLNNEWDIINRGIFLFDTDSIPDDAVIKSAVFSVYGSAKTDALSITPNVNVYASDPATDTALIAADFATLGAIAFCDTPVTYAGFDVAGYNDFSLNTTGLAAIDVSGVTKLGLRNANYDAAISPPAWTQNLESNFSVYFADEALTTKDPKLVITYTEVEATVTATGIDSGEYTVKTYGVDNEPEWATGDVLHFTGADTSNIDAGDIGDGNKLWMSLWFNLDTAIPDGGSGTDQYLIGKYTDADEYLLVWIEGADGKVYLSHAEAAAAEEISTTETEWALGWHHILASCSTVEGQRLIADGGTAVTDAGNQTAISQTPSDFCIGARDDGVNAEGFIGEIQNVILGIGDLSAEEEAALYTGVAPTGANAPTEYWYIDEGTGTAITSYGSVATEGTADTACSWETVTYTTGKTGRFCDFYIEVDDGVTDADRWGGNLKGVSVPDNANDWKLNQNNVIPKMEYYKHTVGGVEHAWYEPNTIVDATDYDGTADAGSSNIKIIDAELIQADDYWNNALLTITDTTDEGAPEGETSFVTDFDDGTNTLTFSPALTVAPDAGDTYTVDFATLTDRSYYGLDFLGAGADSNVTLGDDKYAEADFVAGLTIEAWIKVDTLDDTTQKIFTMEDRIYIDVEATTDKPRFVQYDGATNVAVADDAILTDTTYYIVGTWDTATNRVYVDADLQTTTAASNIALLDIVVRADRMGDVWPGDGTGAFDGLLDEIRVYNRALDQNEIDSNYNSGAGNYAPSDTSGIIGWWHMEEGSGASAVDTSSSGFDGTIETDVAWGNGIIPRTAGNSGTNDSKLTWGVNSATTLIYDKVISYTTTSSTASEEGGYAVPEADMPTEWYGTASNLANLPLYDMYLGIGNETGIPVQTLYVLSIVTVCFAFAIAGFVMFNSVMMSVMGVGVGLGIGSSMTVVPLWIFFTFLILAIGIMYLKGRSGV